MPVKTQIVVVSKGGDLKNAFIKEDCIDEIAKKCNFKSSDDFEEQHKFAVINKKETHYVHIYAKTEGRANQENKYDFPPPIDMDLYFGSCAIVQRDKDNKLMDLSCDLWNKLYEILFGGFENLDANASEDENEEDELENIPAEMKTSEGYLKDDFVVDDELSIEMDGFCDDNSDESLLMSEEESDEPMFNDYGSELSEESFIFSDEEEN
jgi:hypothetical protein